MRSRAVARVTEMLALAALVAIGCSAVGASTISPTTAGQPPATRWIPSNATSASITAAAAAATAATRFTDAPQTGRADVIKVEAGACDAAGRCTCSIAVPPPCTADAQYREIVNIRQRLVEVDRYLDGSFIRSVATNVTTITARIKTLEETLHKQSVSVSLTEIDGLRRELQLVSSVLRTLEGKVDSAVVSTLVIELDAILRQINALESANPVATQATLEKQLDELRARLAKCKDESLSLSSSPFVGDSFASNETNFRTCSASLDIRVGPQVTHKWRSGIAHSWFRDTRPSDGNRSTQIYEIRSTRGNLALHEWQNYGDYSSARSEYLFKTKCSAYVSGRKHVVLGGFFYYFDYSSGVVTKMDLMTCKLTNTLKLPVEQTELNKYLHGELTYADINYDETGLYVVYTNAAVTGELIIAKVDPVNMTLIKSWETGRQKSTLANVFFVCGRMYTTDSFTVRHLTGKQFGYDTNTGAEFLLNIDVESRLGGVYQLSYNPRDRMIFGVDNSHSVTYDVYWD